MPEGAGVLPQAAQSAGSCKAPMPKAACLGSALLSGAGMDLGLSAVKPQLCSWDGVSQAAACKAFLFSLGSSLVVCESLASSIPATELGQYWSSS